MSVYRTIGPLVYTCTSVSVFHLGLNKINANIQISFNNMKAFSKTQVHFFKLISKVFLETAASMQILIENSPFEKE